MSLEEEGIIEKYNNIIIYTEPRLSTALFLYVKEPTIHVLFIVHTFCYNILEIRLRKVHNERENMAIYFIDGDNNPKEHIKGIELLAEYSCAMKSHFRKFGNQMSGSGNHLCNYASLLA